MVLTDKLRRPSALAATAILLAASFVPLLSSQRADAYGLLASRKITMSNSAVGSATDGQNVTYQASFNIATTASVGGVVIDFCSTSPIIGDTCTAPTGFTLASATLNAQTGLSGFAESGDADNDTNTFIIVNATPQSMTAADPVTITIAGVTNPTTLGTFYARILTYNTQANAENYSSTAADGGTGNVDAGGIALSTAEQITVTSKVQERLVFCVYADEADAEYANNDCTSKQGTSVILGDTNGVLDPSGVYVSKAAQYGITTNASGSAVIRAKGATLTSGSFTIDAFGGTANTSTPGSEEFGFCTYQVSGTGMTIDTLYDGDSGGNTSTACSGTTDTAGTGSTGGDNSAAFAFEVANLTSTYGDDIATKPAGGFSTGKVVFAGNISNTTEAGIYTSTLTFIATGTY